jgi:hypothetical protein
MSRMLPALLAAGLAGTVTAMASPAFAAAGNVCAGLPNHATLKAQLAAANAAVDLTLNNDMWGTIVAADGTVCAVAFTGGAIDQQWLLSRVISAQKANTANGLSLPAGAGGNLPGLALSTANLWKPTQPGGFLFGLQFSNPVDTNVAYGGNSGNYGQANDPMVGKKIGGVNVFGGGVALYDSGFQRIGGLGVSGDSSCRDHMVAWETRHNLGLDYVPNGLSAQPRPDNIIFDTSNAFGHPNCLDEGAEKTAAAGLSPTQPPPP